MRFIGQLACAGVSMIALAGGAYAQDSAAPPAGEASAADIVVTGTLIRGSEAVGSQTIGVDQTKIEAIGAANTSDLIAAIPQAGNFLGFVGVRGSSNFSLAVNRPTLRYLGNTSSSTASTLLLLDGHRMPGMGILQSSPDLDAIAAGAIERVEIVTDGGSSIYGSDAVGGVMNFITRKRFDGVEVKGSYGFADDYQQANAAITAGKAWDWGSAYVSYDYSWHDELFGFDRDWSRSLNWPLTQASGFDVGSSTNCMPGNVTVGATTVPLPGLTGSPNRCDLTEYATIYPRETKHSAFASFVFDNGGPVSASVKAFYVNRVSDSKSDLSTYAQNILLRSNSPFFTSVPGVANVACPAPNAALSCETVVVNFGSVLGTSIPQTTRMESWGITPSFKVDMGGEWQLNFLANYGVGKARFIGNLFNTSPITAAAAPTDSVTGISSGPGTFDPFNLGAAGNAAAIATARDWFQYGRATNELINARMVADGPLFALPGGDVRVAVGVEYMYEQYSGVTTRNSTAAGIAALTDTVVSRNVKSVFGEINVPIVGEGNRGFIHGLSFTASGRYDHYSDFGSTFNPKFGVNLEPVEGLKLRGNWGKAFQAPGLSDLAQATAQSVSALPTSSRPFFDPATPVPAVGHNAWIIAFGGTIPGLKPQKATTWSLGFDIEPTAIPTLQLGATYYNIDFKGLIGIAPIFQSTFYALFADKAVVYSAGDPAMSAYFNSLAANVSPASAASVLSTVGGVCSGAACFTNVYSVLDGRTTNLARVQTSGIDFYARYSHEVGFGNLYLDIAGTYILTLKQGGTTATLDVNGIDPNNRFKMSTTVGANIHENLKAQITWAHTGGERIAPTAQNLQQSYIEGMDVFNLFVQYKVPSESTMLNDLTLSLNVDNIFDTDVPLYRGGTNSLFGAANGFTLGRVVKFGVSKKF